MKIFTRIFTSCILAIVLLQFPICAFAADEMDFSLSNVHISLSSQNVLAYYINDFDGDGNDEAFALVGEKKREGTETLYSAEVWFIEGDHSLKIMDSKFYGTDGKIIGFNDRDFLLLNEKYATGETAYLWGVENGKPKLQNISGYGGDLKCIGGNDIVLTHSVYDSGQTNGVMSGHTWKEYYFYFDCENNCFCEYGAINITEEQLLMCLNAKEYIEQINNHGYSITDILYRANGIININYSNGSANRNMTLLLKNDTVFLVPHCSYGSNDLDISDQGGIYLDAMVPDIATYPNAFPAISTSNNAETLDNITSQNEDNTVIITDNRNDVILFIVLGLLSFIALLELVIIIIAKRKNNEAK